MSSSEEEPMKNQITFQFDEQNLQENEHIKKLIKENCQTINEAKTPYRYNFDSDSEGESDPNIPRRMTPVEHMDRISSALERKLENLKCGSDEESNDHTMNTTDDHHVTPTKSIPINRQIIEDNEYGSYSPKFGELIIPNDLNGHSPNKHIGFSMENPSPSSSMETKPEGDHEHETPEFKQKRKEHYNEYLVMKRARERNQQFFKNGEVSEDESDSSDDE
ncbi:predicted protein [Naegleria gruberi]|uniref:Predicted protein n=1 Tax=Naegleria gruberi TaxID=5762 RepID=D2V9C1_NAEGR|nr:uncharacterized protein NAEGRDRAFT_47664 [Naegleria gruberi]EFC46432.1 predicted protein [Naegleria gruberi]|eukprot:XP_002679176.1 predicted protein [Naegleria gruberi strain NEG-M]